MQVDETKVQAFLRARNDPAYFHSRILGQPPYYPHQRKMCDLVLANDTSVIVSGNAIGKTVFLASLLLWYLYTRPNARVISTATTAQQLAGGLWVKVREFHRNAVIPLDGTITKGLNQIPQILRIDNNWYAIGITSTNVESLSGQRSSVGSTLVLCDEASGVSDEVFEAITSIGCDRMVLVGNPLRNYGFFRDRLIADFVSRFSACRAMEESLRLGLRQVAFRQSLSLG
jgi:hypothetical protein